MKIAVALALCVASVQGMALCAINTTLRAERLACEWTTSVDASQTHALRPRACARLRVYGRCTVCIMCVELYMWAYTKWCILNLYIFSQCSCTCRPCLCGDGDAGCFWCGACRVCADVEIPPEHPLQQHQMWDYSTAREQVRKLYRASYKGHLPLTGQGA